VDAPAAPVALPSIAFQANASDRVAIRPGMPLLLQVRLANPRAMNAALEKKIARERAEEIKEHMGRGVVSKETGEKMLAALTSPEIGALTLPAGSNWEQLVSVRVISADGKENLAWKAALLPAVRPQPRVLDAEQQVELDYGIAAEQTAALAPGEYRLSAVLAPSAAGGWSDSAMSRPVALIVLNGSARMEASEEERVHVGAARYYRAVGDTAKARDAVRKALAVHAHSIDANILLAEMLEEAGDLPAALATFQRAIEDYERQHPNSQEPHPYLTMRVGALLHKLAEK
jgi:tetratricopeptide (TPR) repeat protein